MSSLNSFFKKILAFGREAKGPGRCPFCHEPRLTNPCSNCGAQFMITAEELHRLLSLKSSAPILPPKDPRSKQAEDLKQPLPQHLSGQGGIQWREINWGTDRDQGSSNSLRTAVESEQAAARLQAGQGAFEDAVRATIREVAPHKLDSYEAALALEKENDQKGGK